MEDCRAEVQGIQYEIFTISNTHPKRIEILIFEQNKEASFTYGCLDPVMVTQMAKYLDTVYVSGWQCSSTASSTDEPGPDLADYPMVIFASQYRVLTRPY